MKCVGTKKNFSDKSLYNFSLGIKSVKKRKYFSKWKLNSRVIISLFRDDVFIRSPVDRIKKFSLF